MRYGIIYKATSPTGKVYIGQTVKSLAKRKSMHKFMAVKGDCRTPFQIALLNDGFSNFIWEEIDKAGTAEELDQKEKYWITYYDSMNPSKGYNNTDGGIHCSPSADTRQKLSEAQRGKSPWNKGKSLPKETRQKMSDSKKGKSLSMETRQKIKVSMKRYTPWNKGKHLSEEMHCKYIDSLRRNNSFTTPLTENIVRQIKNDLSNGMRNCDVAKKYDVNKSTVKNIKLGRTWKWLSVSV